MEALISGCFEEMRRETLHGKTGGGGGMEQS